MLVNGTADYLKKGTRVPGKPQQTKKYREGSFTR